MPLLNALAKFDPDAGQGVLRPGRPAAGGDRLAERQRPHRSVRASVVLRIAPFFLVVFLVSCASSPPRRQSASFETPVPPAWMTGADAGAPVEEWWHTFADPELAAVVEKALERNHDLQAAVARLDAAIAQARIAGADLAPRLGFDFGARRQKQNFIGLPIPGAEDRVLSATSTSYGVGLNTSWELDLWGRIRSGRRAALADVQASEADLAGARSSLAAQSAKTWVALVEAKRQAQLAQVTVENYRATAEHVRTRYERGVGSPLDLRLALTSLSAAEAVLSERESQRQRLIRQLEILFGNYPAGAFRTASDLPAVPGEVPAGLPSELLERRPDLVAAERRFAAADARVKQARAALLPRISLSASGGTASNELADLLSGSFTVWTLAANLAQPIFEGGRLRAGVGLASARSREAAEEYVSAALRAFSEIETALVVEGLLARREAELAAAAEQAGAALDLAETRYTRGLEPFLSVLEAQRRAWDTESRFINVRRQRFENRIDLHLALGGGFGQSAAVPAEPAAAFFVDESDSKTTARAGASAGQAGGRPHFDHE